jgi:hypothetical protein
MILQKEGYTRRDTVARKKRTNASPESAEKVAIATQIIVICPHRSFPFHLLARECEKTRVLQRSLYDVM